MKISLSIVFPVILSLGFSLRAQDKADLQATAYRNSIAQDEVRKQTEAVRQSLNLLLEDFYQNQLQSKGSTEARNVAEQLAGLSDKQIEPLIQMLKEAGTGQGQGVENKLATASQGQKKVQIDLKTLENRLALHINLASTQQRLGQLMMRQAANLRHSRDFEATRKDINQLPTTMLPLVSVWQSEQGALKKEIDLLLESMAKVVAEIPEAERPGFAQAVAEAQRLTLPVLATSASDQSSAGNVGATISSQSGVLDALQSMMLKLVDALPTADRLQTMKEKFQQLADEQKQLAAEAKKPEAMKKDLQEAQAKLNDELTALKKEAVSLNAKAAMQADQAVPAMNKAAGLLNDEGKLSAADKNQIAKAQEEAAQKLQAAGDAVQQQLDKLAGQKNAPPTAAQALQNLAQLDQQVKAAQAQQQALDKKPDAAAQQQLANQTAEIQQEALSMSPDAAQNLGEAAAQMQQDPAKANEALAEAGKAIQQQMQDLQQATAQQQQLQVLGKEIAAAKAQAQQAAQTLAKEGKNDLNPAMQQMQQAQQTLQQAEQAPAAAQAALKEAQKALEAAILNAAQTKKEAAAAANAQAQKAMDQAMGAVNEAMAQADAQAAAAAPGMAQNGAPKPGQPGAPKPGPEGPATDGQAGQGIKGGVQQFIGSAGGPATQGQVSAGLNPKDRDAIASFKKEKAPAEYQAMVQQYLKNLAEGSTPSGAAQ